MYGSCKKIEVRYEFPSTMDNGKYFLTMVRIKLSMTLFYALSFFFFGWPFPTY